MIVKKLLSDIESIKQTVLSNLRRHPRVIHLTADDLEDSFQDSLLQLLTDPTEEPIETKNGLIAVLTAKTLGLTTKEQNQQRNDYRVMIGYTGMSQSRHPRTVYPDLFIQTLPPLQQTLAKCLNARMFYKEINDHLKGKFEGSIGLMRAKYKKWLASGSSIEPKLTSEDEAILRSTKLDKRCIELLRRLIGGEIISRVAEDLGMKTRTAYNLKYESLRLLPHLRKLIPIRRNKPSKKLTAVLYNKP